MIGSRTDKADQVIKVCFNALTRPETRRNIYLYNFYHMNTTYVRMLDQDESVSIRKPVIIICQ